VTKAQKGSMMMSCRLVYFTTNSEPVFLRCYVTFSRCNSPAPRIRDGSGNGQFRHWVPV